MPGNASWESDSTGGRPSSINLLLQWLVTPGNAGRWLRVKGKRDGSRRELSTEIHATFVAYGIKHRSRGGIEMKVLELFRQVEAAEKWLEDRQLSRYDVSDKTKRTVLQMCPYFQELATSLRSSRVEETMTPSTHGEETSSEASYENSEGDSSAVWADSHRVLPEEQHKLQPFKKCSRTMWDSDGRPSSLDVLLKWVEIPGNAARWLALVQHGECSRLELAADICDLLRVYGITYRTPRGVDSKLYELERQFDEAKSWLKERGLDHWREARTIERKVLQICPVYPKIEPLLRQAAARSRTSSSRALGVRFRKPELAELPGTKRMRIENSRAPSQRTAEGKCRVMLKAAPEERRDFFKLELQVKRDHAICVRAKVRKEMLDMGVSHEDVDRLLPL